MSETEEIKITPESIVEESVSVEVLDKDDFTPHQYWCLFGEGVERAFTGNLYDLKEVGTYHCACCDTPLFDSSHKYTDESGRPSFWHYEDDSVRFDNVEDKEEFEILKEKINKSNVSVWRGEFKEVYDSNKSLSKIKCNNCESFIGVKFRDGPPPKFERYSCNSASLVFKEKEWFDTPSVYRKRREAIEEEIRRKEEAPISDRLRFDKDAYADVAFFPEDGFEGERGN